MVERMWKKMFCHYFPQSVTALSKNVVLGTFELKKKPLNFGFPLFRGIWDTSHTGFPSPCHVVHGSLAIGHLNIVPSLLCSMISQSKNSCSSNLLTVEGNHLLGTFDTLCSVVVAVFGDLSRCNLFGRC